MEEGKYAQWFWLLNFALLSFRLLYINLPQLAPQEAYYWNYSRHLALSYFDHPPLHAWLIYLSTRLGVSEFTVRFFAPLFAFGTTFFSFLAARLLFNARVAFYFVLTLNAVLIFNIGSVIITPDVPLLFFWSLSFYLLAKLIITQKAWLWYPLGISLGLAMLSKYTAIFIPISVALFLLVSRNDRFWFTRKEPYLAILLSILIFSPVLIWNAQYDWASFAFQTSRRVGELGSLSIRHFLAFVGSQLAVVSPLIYGAMIYALVKLGSEVTKEFRFFVSLGFARDKSFDSAQDKPLRMTDKAGSHPEEHAIKVSRTTLLLLCWSVPVILFFTLVSFKYWVKINWPAPGYVAAILATVTLYVRNSSSLLSDEGKGEVTPANHKKRNKTFALTSLIIGFILVLLGYASPFLPISLGRGEAIYGWKELALTVEAVRQKMEADNPIIIGYEYKTASELAFYLPDRPETFSNNFVGENGLAYDFWSNPNDYIGRNAIFVYDQRFRYKNPENLTGFFDKVERETELQVSKRGRKVTTFHIYRCYGYKGAS